MAWRRSPRLLVVALWAIAACLVFGEPKCEEATFASAYRAKILGVRKFVGMSGDARCMAFSPGGDVAATGHWNGSVKLWNVASGRNLRTIRMAHTGAVLAVAFDSVGGRLSTASADKTAAVWPVHSPPQGGAPLQRFEGHEGWVVTVAFGGGDDLLATGSNDKYAKLWNVTTGSLLRSLPEHESALLSVAVSPDGQLAFTSAGDKSTRLWTTATGFEERMLKGHKGWVVSAGFSPDGAMLLTGSHDNSARLWNVVTGKRLMVFEAVGNVLSAALSPDGRLLITGTREGLTTVWDVESGAPLREIKNSRRDPIVAVAFAGDGSKILIGSFKKGKTKRELKSEEMHAQCEANCAAQGDK